jgi:putative membrane protein
LATYLVLAPMGRESLGSPRSSAALAWHLFWPAAGIGVGQAVLLTVVLAWPLHLDAGQWLQFVTLAAAGAIAFIAANQGLAALLGSIGRFVSAAVAVATLATAVVSTVPMVLTGGAALLPTTPLIAGLRAVVYETSGLVAAWTLLALWALIGFAATVAATARKRVIDIGQLARWARAARPLPDRQRAHTG